jgi:tRNA pseudouridine55 synthase
MTVSSGGILVVDKPAAWTSHDVVAKCRHLTGIRRIGHAGTLDPDATGLLLVCLGQATRLVEYLMELPKTYQVRMKLGEETDSEDSSGKVVARRDLGKISEAKIRACLARYQGEIQQVPPLYSALKFQGKRLYRYAREGKMVEREPRRVTVYEIGSIDLALPYLSYRVKCSRGTYVRSLCRDMGRDLGVGGHLVSLRRTESASFTEADAIPLTRLLEMEADEILSHLTPMDHPLSGFSRMEVQSGAEMKVCRGQALSPEDLCHRVDPWPVDLPVRIYSENGRFLAMGKSRISPEGSPRLYPQKVFCVPQPRSFA